MSSNPSIRAASIDRDVVIEHPAVDVAAMIADLLSASKGGLCARSCTCPALCDGRAHRGSSCRQRSTSARVAQPDRDEDVVPRAAIDEQPRHVRRLAHQVLGGSRFVIDVARIDVGAAIDQVLRDLDGASAMQRRLSVAAARVRPARDPLRPAPGRDRAYRGARRRRCRRSRRGRSAERPPPE